MYNKPTLSLIVLRVSDVEHSAAFYSVIGLSFQCEQHGSGPKHFSTTIGNTVLELYPASERFPATALRLGFIVDSVNATLSKYRQINCKVLVEPQQSAHGLRAVIVDPDRHRIELTEKTT